MSFILTVWRQPAGRALPTHIDEAQAQLDSVQAADGAEPDPAFGDFARALKQRFGALGDVDPDGDGEGAVYELGSVPAVGWADTASCFNIGLHTGSEQFDAAYAHAVV